MARLNLAIRPVNSLKHVVDTATSAVAGGIVSVVILSEAEDAPVAANPTHVRIGSVINSIYIRVEVKATANFNTVPRIYMAIQKNPGNEHPSANPSSIGDSDLRKFIIHQEMTMVGEASDNSGGLPRTMFQGVVKLPSRYRRFGVNDRLICTFSLDDGETTAIVNACVQCIYKEFF